MKTSILKSKSLLMRNSWICWFKTNRKNKSIISKPKKNMKRSMIFYIFIEKMINML